MAAINIYAYCDDQLVEPCKEMGITMVDEGNAPHEWKFQGPYLQLVKLLALGGWFDKDDFAEGHKIQTQIRFEGNELELETKRVKEAIKSNQWMFTDGAVFVDAMNMTFIWTEDDGLNEPTMHMNRYIIDVDGNVVPEGNPTMTFA